MKSFFASRWHHLNQLNHIIDASYYTVEKCDEFDRTRYIVGKFWDLKLQIHMIEKESTQLTDVIGHIITLMLHLYSEGIITRSLFVYVCTHLYTR